MFQPIKIWLTLIKTLTFTYLYCSTWGPISLDDSVSVSIVFSGFMCFWKNKSFDFNVLCFWWRIQKEEKERDIWWLNFSGSLLVWLAEMMMASNVLALSDLILFSPLVCFEYIFFCWDNFLFTSIDLWTKYKLLIRKPEALIINRTISFFFFLLNIEPLVSD